MPEKRLEKTRAAYAEKTLFEIAQARIASGRPLDREYIESPERQAILAANGGISMRYVKAFDIARDRFPQTLVVTTHTHEGVYAPEADEWVCACGARRWADTSVWRLPEL